MSFLNWKNPVMLVCCFLLVTLIRFNRNSWLVERDLADAAFYIGNVEYFRGDPVTYGLRAPFNERILVTMAASVLPFDPMTSINLVNLLFLLAALYFLYLTAGKLGIGAECAWAGLYLFVFSFPTFYYSTIGYVDSGVLLMIFAGTYALYSGNYLLFLITVILGTIAKEGVVVLLPVAFALGYVSKKRKCYGVALIAGVLYVVIWGLVKVYAPNTHGNTPLLYWHPGKLRFLSNLCRPNLYVSSLLGMGIPVALVCIYLVRYGKVVRQSFKEDLPLWCGTAGGFMLWFYSLFSAYADGRFFWISSCYTILLAMRWWSRYGAPFGRKESSLSRRI